MTDPLAQLARPVGDVVTRVYVGTITAVDDHLCTVDPHDGEEVAEVPWYGQTPAVEDEVVMLLFGGQLLVISAGRPA